MASNVKQKLRERIWSLLERRRVARFPFTATGRIPNFQGAEQATALAAALPEWQRARRLKCNPDAPQRALVCARYLKARPCSWQCRVSRTRGVFCASIRRASASDWLRQLGQIDLVVTGSVAVNARGARVGKAGATAIWNLRSPAPQGP